MNATLTLSKHQSNVKKEKDSFSPSCDQWETSTVFVYCFDLPGVSREAIEVVIDGKVLKLSGHRSCLSKGECSGKVECAHGPFERTLTLPDGADATAAKARYHDGILKIEIPHAQASVPVRVPVEEVQPLLAPNGWVGEFDDDEDMDLDPCLD